MFSILSKIFSKLKPNTNTSPNPLDYEKLIHLDAEHLAEQGIATAYQRLLPKLSEWVTHPVELSDIFDPDLPSYQVVCNGDKYLIYSSEEAGTEALSWGRATYVFFLIINQQLTNTDIRFYAINEGNDLGGMFLSPEQARAAQQAISSKRDWPYIPELNDPWYGQFH